MTAPIEYLDVEDLLRLATVVLGGDPLVRDVGLLEAAAARPAASVFGVDAYDDLWAKAAALLQSLVKNHALVDGNKRSGAVAALLFLELNNIEISAPTGSIYEQTIAVANGLAGKVELTEFFRDHAVTP